MAAVEPLRVEVERQGARATARVSGELDLASRALLRDHLQDLLQPDGRAPVDRLVVDLSGLAFVDVSGLAVLLEAEEQLRARGGTLELAGARPIVHRVLRVLGLEDRLRPSLDGSYGSSG